jgi:hypothetical protein
MSSMNLRRVALVRTGVSEELTINKKFHENTLQVE